MIGLQKFTEEITEQTRILRNMSTVHLSSNLEWVRLLAKATAVENSGIIVKSILGSSTGSYEDRVQTAQSVLNDLKAQAESTIGRIYEQDPNTEESSSKTRLITADAQSAGYTMVLNLIQKELV